VRFFGGLSYWPGRGVRPVIGAMWHPSNRRRTAGAGGAVLLAILILLALALFLSPRLSPHAQRTPVLRAFLGCLGCASDHRHRWLLRALRERPRCWAAEQHDEIAPFPLTGNASDPSRAGSTSQDIGLQRISQRARAKGKPQGSPSTRQRLPPNRSKLGGHSMKVRARDIHWLSVPHRTLQAFRRVRARR
jgi:hypothetical protein